MIKNSLKDVEISKEITNSGKGLCILICAEYNYHSNWMAYASWYSIYKNLPDAKVAISVPRSNQLEHYYYHWTYKCEDLRFNLHKNMGDKKLNKLCGVYISLRENLVKKPLIVIEPEIMAVREISQGTINSLNKVESANYDKLWYFRDQDILKDNKVEDLISEANEHRNTTFTSYDKGCGNFKKSDWEKGKTLPPFNLASALHYVDTTVNENKILSLWSQMNSFWEIANQI